MNNLIGTYKSFKGRHPQPGMEVFVYRNLKNGKWSVRCTQSNLVLCHAEEVQLTGCSFVVNEAGRQRVLETQEKNVHAGVVGVLEAFIAFEPSCDFDAHLLFELGCRELTYNPYKYTSFVDAQTEKAIETSELVQLMSNKRVFYSK